MLLRLTILFLSVGIGTAAHADILSCPTLSTAAQVGVCPSEDELRATYIGYCSDDARIYDLADKDTCVNYGSYRRQKNVVLWEAGDGFQAYLSCDLPADTVKQAKPAGIAVKTRGALTRVVCTYPQDITFVYRTREQCTVEGSGSCGADPASCKAGCEPREVTDVRKPAP